MFLFLAFEPVSCAVAMSLLEHTLSSIAKHPRACCRTKVWLLRRAPEVFDAALNEASEPVLDALNALDHYLYAFLAVHKKGCWGGGGTAAAALFAGGLAALLLLCVAVFDNNHKKKRPDDR